MILTFAEQDMEKTEQSLRLPKEAVMKRKHKTRGKPRF